MPQNLLDPMPSIRTRMEATTPSSPAKVQEGVLAQIFQLRRQALRLRILEKVKLVVEHLGSAFSYKDENIEINTSGKGEFVEYFLLIP